MNGIQNVAFDISLLIIGPTSNMLRLPLQLEARDPREDPQACPDRQCLFSYIGTGIQRRKILESPKFITKMKQVVMKESHRLSS